MWRFAPLFIRYFSIGGDFLLPVNSGGHTAYQNFVVENLSKYYPNPDAIARSTWDIIDKVLILFRILTLPSCFLILPTMQCLIMNTANVQESLHSSI
jgi:hypothetical protein